MARKEIEITIEEGRDAGKTFKITEMPAVPADRWVTRALCLLGKSKTDLSNLEAKAKKLLEIYRQLGTVNQAKLIVPASELKDKEITK